MASSHFSCLWAPWSSKTSSWGVGWWFSHAQLLQTVAYQAPLSIGFSRQEYWSGVGWCLQSIYCSLAYLPVTVDVTLMQSPLGEHRAVSTGFVGDTHAALVVKNPPPSAGDTRDMGSIPGLGRPPGGGHGNPLQYSCPENPTDRGARRATVHRVAKNWAWLKRLSMHGPMPHWFFFFFKFKLFIFYWGVIDELIPWWLRW